MDGRRRKLYALSDRPSKALVALVRRAYKPNGAEPRSEQLISDLHSSSPRFRRDWELAGTLVADDQPIILQVRRYGTLRVLATTLSPLSRPATGLFLATASDEHTAKSLRFLKKMLLIGAEASLGA